MKISAILMASGESKRYGENKAFLEFKNKSFIELILDKLMHSKVYEIKAVVNENLYGYLQKIGLDTRVEVLLNTKCNQGQSESIKFGVKRSGDVDGFMFLALDQPLLSLKSIDTIISNYQKGTILVPCFGGIKTLPTIFSSDFKDELLQVEGDKGGRDIIKAHKDKVKVLEMSNANEGFDVDTKEDFKKLQEMI